MKLTFSINLPIYGDIFYDETVLIFFMNTTAKLHATRFDWLISGFQKLLNNEELERMSQQISFRLV